MKENKLIEMSNKIDTMGNVLNRIIQEAKHGERYIS